MRKANATGRDIYRSIAFILYIHIISANILFIFCISSWITSWCHHQNMHLSKNARVGDRKTLARRRSGSRPSVSRPPRYCRARSADRTGLSSVDRRPRHPSVPSARPTTSSRTTRIRIRRVASTLLGEDPRNCNSSSSSTWLFVCARLRKKIQEVSKTNQQYLWQFFFATSKARIYANDINDFYKYDDKYFFDFGSFSLLIIVLSYSIIIIWYNKLLI